MPETVEQECRIISKKYDKKGLGLEQKILLAKEDYAGIIRLGVISDNPNDPYSDSVYNIAAARIMDNSYCIEQGRNVHSNNGNAPEFCVTLAVALYLKRDLRYTYFNDEFKKYVAVNNLSEEEVKQIAEAFICFVDEEHKKYDEIRRKNNQEATLRKLENGEPIV